MIIVIFIKSCQNTTYTQINQNSNSSFIIMYYVYVPTFV